MKKKIILEIIALMLVLVIAVLLILNMPNKKTLSNYYECKTEVTDEEMYSTYNSFIINYDKDGLITKIKAYQIYQINDKNVYLSFMKNKTRKYIDTYKKNKQIKDPMKLPDGIVGKSVEMFTKNDAYTCTLKEG